MPAMVFRHAGIILGLVGAAPAANRIISHHHGKNITGMARSYR